MISIGRLEGFVHMSSRARWALVDVASSSALARCGDAAPQGENFAEAVDRRPKHLLAVYPTRSTFDSAWQIPKTVHISQVASGSPVNLLLFGTRMAGDVVQYSKFG